jgi:hypothetical protein
MVTWTKGLDKLMKDRNDCKERKSCNGCKNIDHCKIGTPLEKEQIKA